MRQAFYDREDLAEAEYETGWAEVIIEVDGGYMAFESVDDAKTWQNQE